MWNKNKYIVSSISKCIGYEELVLRYIPEIDDPKYDDLPSEQLNPGDTIYAKFTPVNKEQVPEFNSS